MLDKDRGTYTPPTEDSLSFEPRRNSARDSAPITLILSGILLFVLLIAVVLFYNSGLNRHANVPEIGETLGQYRETVEDAKPLPDDEIMQAGVSFAAGGDSSAVAVIDEAPPTAAPIEGPLPSQAQSSALAATTATSASSASSQATPVAAGSVSVQIGAFTSREIADRQYASVASSYGLFLDGTSKRVEEVQSNGSTLYRTSFTGFNSREKARSFCDALKAAGRDCFVK